MSRYRQLLCVCISSTRNNNNNKKKQHKNHPVRGGRTRVVSDAIGHRYFTDERGRNYVCIIFHHLLLGPLHFPAGKLLIFSPRVCVLWSNNGRADDCFYGGGGNSERFDGDVVRTRFKKKKNSSFILYEIPKNRYNTFVQSMYRNA